MNSSCGIIDATLCVMAARGSPNQEGNQSPAGKRREDQEPSRGAALTLNPPSSTRDRKTGKEGGRDGWREEGSVLSSLEVNKRVSFTGGGQHSAAVHRIMFRGARPRRLISRNTTNLQINDRRSFARRPCTTEHHHHRATAASHAHDLPPPSRRPDEIPNQTTLPINNNFSIYYMQNKEELEDSHSLHCCSCSPQLLR